MPLPSITKASGGMETLFPTETMRPLAMTTVPLSMTAPEIGTMRALVIAK